jgi:hypothetical protein
MQGQTKGEKEQKNKSERNRDMELDGRQEKRMNAFSAEMNQKQHSKRLGYAFQNTSERMLAML